MAARGYGPLLRDPMAKTHPPERCGGGLFDAGQSDLAGPGAGEKSVRRLQEYGAVFDSSRDAGAASAIDFINQSKGKTAMRDLLVSLNENSTPAAIEKLFGVPFATFETRWKAFLKSKKLKEIEGSRVRKLKVKKDQKEDEEVVELREIQSAVARQRTYLGDQILGKGRPQAAVNEYQRALQASPRSPIILNKLGRVFIQMKRFDEALPHLQTALELDPDNANTYVQLARVYHAGKHYSESQSALEEAIQI